MHSISIYKYPVLYFSFWDVIFCEDTEELFEPGCFFGVGGVVLSDRAPCQAQVRAPAARVGGCVSDVVGRGEVTCDGKPPPPGIGWCCNYKFNVIINSRHAAKHVLIDFLWFGLLVQITILLIDVNTLTIPFIVKYIFHNIILFTYHIITKTYTFVNVWSREALSCLYNQAQKQWLLYIQYFSSTEGKTFKWITLPRLIVLACVNSLLIKRDHIYVCL